MFLWKSWRKKPESGAARFIIMKMGFSLRPLMHSEEIADALGVQIEELYEKEEKLYENEKE